MACPTCGRKLPVIHDCEAVNAVLAEMTGYAADSLDLLEETTHELERIFRNLGSVGDAKIVRKARAFLDAGKSA